MDYKKEKEILQEKMSKGEINPKEFDIKMAECERKLCQSSSLLLDILGDHNDTIK